MHPSYDKTKTYEVTVRGDILNGTKLLQQPLVIDGHTVKAASIKIRERTANGGILEISIKEGRNRQIRKMCGQCGLVALTLKRISIGTLELGDLKPGQWRHLTPEEIKSARPN